MQFVAGIKKEDIVACGHVERFVHGIVKPLIGFGETSHFVAYTGHAVAFLIVMYLFQSVVLRIAVNDEVFYKGVVLLFHTVNGPGNEFSGIVGNSGYRNFKRGF